MIITLIVAAALAPVAALAAAPSGDATKNAKSDCTALKASLGGTAFLQAYGTLGGCVSKFARIEQQSIESAQASCTSQQADASFAASHDSKTFAQFYGTGKNGRNALGNCVSSLAKASSQAERQGRLNPARTCRASRTQMGTAAFASLYGKNANDKNAFGKCVTATAETQAEDELSASAACRAEQSDTTFASTHDGQASDQVYASFGKCVSGKAKAASTALQHATTSAAKQCYPQLKADAATFKTTYRTFGRCVSQTAKG